MQTEQYLPEFFSELRATVQTSEKHQKRFNRALAPDFNPMLHFFKVKENKTSEILAFLLDPKAEHGQGNIFLEDFLKRINVLDKINLAEPIEIHREFSTPDNRRIDLYLRFNDGAYGIGIENKIYAGEQKQQVAHYLETP